MMTEQQSPNLDAGQQSVRLSPQEKLRRLLLEIERVTEQAEQMIEAVHDKNDAEIRKLQKLVRQSHEDRFGLHQTYRGQLQAVERHALQQQADAAQSGVVRMATVGSWE